MNLKASNRIGKGHVRGRQIIGRQLVLLGAVKCCAGLGLGLLLSCAACADSLDDYVQAEMAKRHIPGLSLAVVREGQLLIAKGYGLANVELGVPASAATV